MNGHNPNSAGEGVPSSNNDHKTFFNSSSDSHFKPSKQSSIISMMPNTFNDLEIPLPSLSPSSNEFFGSTSVSASDLRLDEQPALPQITMG